MATIRVRDWTKEQIEKIRDTESHSSHDSVIKSLLKDRKLAKYADDAAEAAPESISESRTNEPDTAFDDLTVLGELSGADNGVLFLWCPNCGNELAHLTADNPLGLSVFEIECQRCLTHLDRHAIVAIEIGYPIEQKLVEDCLQDDLKSVSWTTGTGHSIPPLWERLTTILTRHISSGSSTSIFGSSHGSGLRMSPLSALPRAKPIATPPPVSTSKLSNQSQRTETQWIRSRYDGTPATQKPTTVRRKFSIALPLSITLLIGDF